MKTCPTCNTQYTDDTLMYCLQDGTTLVASPGAAPSTVWGGDDEFETAVRAKYLYPGPGERKEDAGPRDAPPFRSKTPLLVAAIAIATLLIFSILGLGAWLYFQGSDAARNTSNERADRNSTSQSNASSTRTPTPQPSLSTTPANASPTPPPVPNVVDKEEASREVSKQIRDWEDLSESGDLDAYMSKYAGTVDYYRKRGASADFVRRDKQRAFGMYDSMSVDISNLDVSVDDSGERAVATFDKEWEFEGERRSTGKVRQQLELRKINGKWLITGERDLRVY